MKLKPKAREFVRLVERAGWSQAETARRLQITPGAVSQICTGRTQPRAATLNLLKLMLSRGEPDSRVPSKASGHLLPWEMELLRQLRRVSPEKRQALLAAFRPLINAFKSRRDER